MTIMNRLSRQTSRVDGRVNNPMPSLEECPELVTMAESLGVEQPAQSPEHSERQAQSRPSEVCSLDAGQLK